MIDERAEKQTAIDGHASALNALREEHAFAVTQHEAAHEQLRNDLAASQSRLEELAVKADEHPELTEQVAVLQEQITAESQASAAHEARSAALGSTVGALDGARGDPRRGFAHCAE